LHLHR